MREFDELINEEEMGIKSGLFEKYFSFQMPGDMLKAVYNKNDEKTLIS